MKPHPEITIADILCAFADPNAHVTPEGAPDDAPTDEHAKQMTAKAVALNHVSIICAGCHQEIPATPEVGTCECGQFVCPKCVSSEPPVCVHEPPGAN